MFSLFQYMESGIFHRCIEPVKKDVMRILKPCVLSLISLPLKSSIQLPIALFLAHMFSIYTVSICIYL